MPQRTKRVREAIPADGIDHKIHPLAVGESPDGVEEPVDSHHLLCSYGPGQFCLLVGGHDGDDARAVRRGHLAGRAPHSACGSVDEDDLVGAESTPADEREMCGQVVQWQRRPTAGVDVVRERKDH
nr:hypothetical protein [Streptomyces sp. AC555_RSS877]